ncbi:MAG: AraC family transcriptional regulator, partial [Paenibacillus sp.]|nr:AraC family transcriptional regulator [Paenibacillus sp.]
MNETPRAELALLNQLTDLISRHAPSAGTHRTIVPALSLLHAADLSEPLESVYKPSICIVAQGGKASTLAHETYRYDPSTYVVT